MTGHYPYLRATEDLLKEEVEVRYISITLSYFRVRTMKFASHDPNSLRSKIIFFSPHKKELENVELKLRIYSKM